MLQNDTTQNLNIDLNRLRQIQEDIASGAQTQVLVRQGDDFVDQTPRSGQIMENDFSLLPYPRDLYGNLTASEWKAQVSFQEAARGRATTTNYPDLLRMGVNFDAMSSYAGIPRILMQLCDVVPSMKQQEEYLKDAGMGVAPVVYEGAEYPEAAIDLGSGVTIVNYKRGFKIPVTEEMRRFDQLGKIRDLASQAGMSLATTEDYAIAAYLTATTNYTATSADNNQGNNTATATLTALAYETALHTLTTMKDKNGNYLGVNPTVAFCAPRTLHYLKRLLLVPELQRVHGNTTSEVDGIGTNNPFFGQINTIISSPYIGSGYEWGLADISRGGLKFQRVDPAVVRGPVFDEATDTYWFYPRTWFGVGFKDTRFFYYSNSTTRPTVS